MKNLLKYSSIISLFISVAATQARLITLTPATYATCTVAAVSCDTAYQTAIDSFVSTFETQINASAGIGDLNLGQYFSGIANATSVSNSGLGVDHHSHFDVALFGFGLGAAGVLASGYGISDLASGGSETLRQKIGGMAVGANVTVGLKASTFLHSPLFGFIDPARLKGYVGFFFFPYTVPGYGSASLGALSMMGQYNIVPGTSAGLGAFKWGGVNISSGLRMASFSLKGSVAQTVAMTQNIVVASNNVPTTMSAPITVNMNLSSKDFTIPVEASTSVRLAWIMSLMMGTAFDINVGSASGGVTAPDPTITLTHSSTGPVTLAGSTTVDAAVDTAFANGSGKPTFINWRGFGGVQFEFGVGGFYVTATKAILASQYGINAGLNLFY